MGAIGYTLEETHGFERGVDALTGQKFVSPEDKEKKRTEEIATENLRRKKIRDYYKKRREEERKLYEQARGGFYMNQGQYGRMYNAYLTVDDRYNYQEYALNRLREMQKEDIAAAKAAWVDIDGKHAIQAPYETPASTDDPTTPYYDKDGKPADPEGHVYYDGKNVDDELGKLADGIGHTIKWLNPFD